MKFKKLSFEKIITAIQEDLIGKDNRALAIAILACVLGVAALGIYQSSDTSAFMGIADSRELQINFEYPVELKNIHVLPGQPVKKGDLLLELSQSELNAKLRERQSELSRLEAEMKVRSRMNLLVKNAGDAGQADPLAVRIADLQNEVQYLENQKKNMYVFAELDGVIGSVAFKKGEKAPAFASILTLSPGRPTYIDGFMHESLATKLDVGKTVTVKPVATAAHSVEGVVVSVGSRIIPLPARLQRNPVIPVYGRAVVIEIPPQNDFLLGEKVELTPAGGFQLAAFPTALASATKKLIEPSFPSEPQAMKIPANLARRFSFEPSGVVYLEDVKKFLVVSDDTDKVKSGLLFIVDASGNVDDEVLQIPGIAKISDLESISQNDSYIYLLASQGLTKKQENKPERNYFVRMKRAGLTFTGTESVELRPMLVRALWASSDVRLKTIAKEYANLDIESHFVDGGNLYLALKNPLLEAGQSAILKIKDVNALFSKQELKPDHISIWKTVDFGHVKGAPMHISDFTKLDGQIYATTVCEGEKCGALWKIRENGDKLVPELIREFPNGKPEGVAMDTATNSLFVTFDQKDMPAKFVNIHLQSVAQIKDEK